MKKLFILSGIFFVLTMYSCNNDNKVTITVEEYKKLKGDTIDNRPQKINFFNDSYNFYWVILTDKNGHEYVQNNSLNSYVLMHYPECKLCMQRYKTLENKIDSLAGLK